MGKDFDDFLDTLSDKDKAQEYLDLISAAVEALGDSPDQKSIVQAVTACCISISRNDLKNYHEWVNS